MSEASRKIVLKCTFYMPTFSIRVHIDYRKFAWQNYWGGGGGGHVPRVRLGVHAHETYRINYIIIRKYLLKETEAKR